MYADKLKRLKAQAAGFNEFVNIDIDHIVSEVKDRHEPEASNKEGEPILDVIFAPDPRTGFPRSDLMYIMSRDARPEVANFIRDTLMQQGGQVSGSQDPDSAIDLVKDRRESFEQYSERIKSIIAKYENIKSNEE